MNILNYFWAILSVISLIICVCCSLIMHLIHVQNCLGFSFAFIILFTSYEHILIIFSPNVDIRLRNKGKGDPSHKAIYCYLTFTAYIMTIVDMHSIYKHCNSKICVSYFHLILPVSQKFPVNKFSS